MSLTIEELKKAHSADFILSSEEDNEEICGTCKYYNGDCSLEENGCQTEMMECYEHK